MGNILIVDDNPSILNYIEDILDDTGHNVTKCENGATGLEFLSSDSYDLVISDLAMPGMDGFQLITEVRMLNPDIPIIIITGVGGVEEAVKAIKKGASDFVIKPFQPVEFKVKVEKNLEHYGLFREIETLKRQRDYNWSSDILVGESAVMKRLVSTVKQIAKSKASIFIFGESGTGKELIAKTIHKESDRQDKLFLPIDCSSLSESIIESELFGHVRGAFTGADRNKKGLLEEAHGGTVFLDEIGNLPLQTQSKLLRFLQEKEIKPVGSSKVLKVDVGIISATNMNLRKEIESGRFREDLYYRLSGIEINVPPLRERLDDIPHLVSHFLKKYTKDIKKSISFIEDEAIGILKNCSWNGNVRELEHLIEYALVLEKSDKITANTVLHILPENRENSGTGNPFEPNLTNAVSDFEKNHIIKVIEIAKNNKAKAARMLGISRSVLYEKLKKYDIEHI